MPDLSTITPVTREEEFLDRIARAAASPNLPEVDASDNGDVLTVVSGEWAAAAPVAELPEVTSSNNGQVLTVVSGEWAAASPSGGESLPEVSSADNGKILTVVSGEWAAAASPLVNIPVTETTPGMVYALGKTFSEVQTLARTGYVPFIKIPPWLNGDGDCDELYVGVILQEGDVNIQSQYQIQFSKNGPVFYADGPDTTPVCDMS